MIARAARVFPPELVPLLRGGAAAAIACVANASDEQLERLLTTVFFAGLETYESERHPIRVLFLGRERTEVVVPSDTHAAAPIYRWKLLRFASPRPFASAELVKLAVATANEWSYCAVCASEDGQLEVAGLAREGFDAEGDPFLEVVSPKPGGLSLRNGRHLLLEYERGWVVEAGDDVVFSSGPMRDAIAIAARTAGFEDEELPEYGDAVRALVRAMGAHGRGGILAIHPEEQPVLPEPASYRTAVAASLASLLRLSRRIGQRTTAPPPSRRGSDRPSLRATEPTFGDLLRNAFLGEADRAIDDIGALTGIDGATILNCHLALMAFGVILPVSQPRVVTATAPARPLDFGTTGTRHRAAATYADQHPGTIVFVASEDGPITCLVRPFMGEHVLSSRLGS